MSKPTLYKEKNKNELQSAHTLAKRWGKSIRAARRQIKFLLSTGTLVIFKLQSK